MGDELKHANGINPINFISERGRQMGESAGKLNTASFLKHFPDEVLIGRSDVEMISLLVGGKGG